MKKKLGYDPQDKTLKLLREKAKEEFKAKERIKQDKIKA